MPMPMPFVDPIVIPDAFTVWAATDLHGQAAAVDRLLERAGLMDDRGAWTAPPGTALVVTGDIVDRGPDTVALVRRLVGLRDQARARGGLVALLQGNHEPPGAGRPRRRPDDPAGAAGVRRRGHACLGGPAALIEWAAADGPAIAALVDARAPDFLPALRSFAPWARWRDTLFVHGGPGAGPVARGIRRARGAPLDPRPVLRRLRALPPMATAGHRTARPASVGWSSGTRPSGSP